MKKPNFTSPHVHIQSLDSGSTPTAFAKRELELGTGALVVTDHGTLGACHTVYELAKKNKLIPVLGLEGYFRDDNCPILTAAGVAKTYPKKQRSKDVDTTKSLGFSGYSKYHHITLGFRDYAAFQVGVKLLSRAPVEQHGSETKPLFDWANLEELGASNTTVTTGCLIGMVQRHLLDHNDPVMARKYYERLRSIVKPGNFYVEIFPHDCSHNWVEGVFLRVKDEDGYESTRRFYAGKTLKTNVCELKALDLAMAWAKQAHSTNKHTQLIAVKNRSTWEDFEPVELIDVRHDPGSFIRNECGPYAPDGDVQLGGNRFMLEMAREYGDPILISDDAHYAHPDEKIVQDVRLAQSGSWRFYGNYHRQSSDEAFAYFSSRMGIEDKEFDKWVENSREWAQGFKDFKFETGLSIPTKFYEVKYKDAGCKNSLEYTLKLVRDHGRMDWKDPVRVARLEQEINLLYRNGVVDWLPYFMIAEEVCRLYRDNGKLTGPGRGSAAGLYLSYLLSITHVDPIRYGLSVDRFLTLDRIMSGKPPDIDQDLTDRDLLVGADGTGGWLQQRFGDHVAQISTIMTLKLKSAVLDVARFTLGGVPREIAQLAHSFEVPPQGLEDYKFVFGYEDSGNWVEGSITYDVALKKYVDKYPEQWSVVQKCLGLSRGQSRHACGFLIANRPIWEFIPLTKIGDVVCTQYAAGAVEAVGGLKMDFLVVNSILDVSNALGIIRKREVEKIEAEIRQIDDELAALKMMKTNSLSALSESLDLKESRRKALLSQREVFLSRLKELKASSVAIDGRRVPASRLVPVKNNDNWSLVDIWDLPESQEVFREISTGKTQTVFQFNTPGATQWLRHFAHQKPNGNYAIDSIEAMAAFTALDRPGPLDAKVRTPGSEGEAASQHNMLVEYARRARGLEPSPDIFPIFNKLFPETHGIMIFQEQVQRLYQEVTGCTGAQAEEFRSNVAKKKKDKIIAAYPVFMEGALAKGWSKENAEVVWLTLKTFASYGFNKSHAVCYVVIAYACAYLKHHFPLEWWTAVLSNAKKEEINETFWPHCGKYIKLPDVTKAYKNFEIVGDKIQAPLSLLHGVGPTAHAELVECAPYTDIADFVRKREQWKVDKSQVVPFLFGNDCLLAHERGEPTEKVVKGRSALNDGIVYRLIVSGAMDSLFPGKTTLQALEAFEQAVWDQEQIGKKRPSKKPPKPVKPEYVDIDPLVRYQMRKKILPAYSENLLKPLVEQRHPQIFYKDGFRFRYCDSDESVRITNPSEWVAMQNQSPAEGKSFIRAIIGYVESARVFEHGPKDPVTGVRHTPKPALELVIDMGNEKAKVVKWPGRDSNKLDPEYVQPLEGALVAVVVTKYSSSKGFSIQDLEIIEKPLGEEKDE